MRWVSIAITTGIHFTSACMRESCREELQDWVLNRFHYQRMMPVKDALILAELPSVEARRRWILRIIDQDGDRADEGGSRAGCVLRTRWGLRERRSWTSVTWLPEFASPSTPMSASAVCRRGRVCGGVADTAVRADFSMSGAGR